MIRKDFRIEKGLFSAVATLGDEMLATELADYLVSRGVPFRESHHLVGRAVRQAAEREHTLRSLPLKAYREIDERFGSDLYEALDARRAIERRDVPCGTSPRAVRVQIERAKELLGRREKE